MDKKGAYLRVLKKMDEIEKEVKDPETAWDILDAYVRDWSKGGE